MVLLWKVWYPAKISI